MNIKVQHLLKTASVLLILVVALLGQIPTDMQVEAWQNSLGEGKRVGRGDFPRLPVVMPGADGTTLVLYIVEGDTATQLAVLAGSRTHTNQAEVRISPDGRYVACLRTTGDDLRPVIEVLDTQESRRTIIAERDIGVHGKGVAGETLTSVAWMDDQHVLYSKVRWPDRVEQEASWEAGTPLPIHGEVWSSDVEGKEQRLLASGPIYRVLGASPEGSTLYVTRLIPGREAEREEGFALLDVKSGEMKNLWPAEERGAQEYRNFELATLPDGTLRVLFATAERVDTAVSQPPVIWMADPDSGQAETVGAVGQSRTIPESDITIYDTPLDFLWSPHSKRAFIYLTNGVAMGGVWRVNLDEETTTLSGEAESWGRTGVRLLAWMPEGIVVQSQDALQLLGEDGEIRGEIHFRADDEGALALMQVPNAVVDWDVPHIHQTRDTHDWFDGRWACGPTSMVMALAYYKQLSPHPITVSIPTPHISQYGWYVSTEQCQQGPPVSCTGYTYVSACQGTNTFNAYQGNIDGNNVAGAFGACILNGGANAGRMYEYAEKHDVGHYFTQDSGEVTAETVKAELRGGAVVILRTVGLTGGGHIVVARGYTSDGFFIINDPAGDFHASGYPYNAGGAGVQYTWAEMGPTWYIALYGPEYLPYLRKDSTWDSDITIQNGAPDGWNDANVEVCLMDSDGSLNTTESDSIPVKGIWNLRLSSVFSGNFYGSGVVVRDQTGISTVVDQEHNNERTIYNGIRGGGGSPGWQQAGTQLYAPVVKRNWYGRNSKIYLTNVGGASTDVYAYFYVHDTGNYRGYLRISDLAPNERYRIKSVDAQCIKNSTTRDCCPANSYCSVRFWSTQALAAVVHEDGASGSSPTTHNTFAAAATDNYIPLYKYQHYGQTSGIAVQNTSSYEADVTITYYDYNSSTTYDHDDTIPARAVKAFVGDVPAGFVGSAMVEVTNNRPVVSALYEEGGGEYKVTDSFLAGAQVLFIPELNTAGGCASGISIQNAGDSSATVEIHYHNIDGTSAGTRGPYSINEGKTYVLNNYNGGVPTNFYGSAWIESTNDVPVVAIVNYEAPGSGDTQASYNGSVP